MKSNHPQWALKFKRKGTELRCIRGHYYLYEVSSIWDKDKKRPKKITGKCLGSITPEGFKPSRKNINDILKNNKPKVKSFAGFLFFIREFDYLLKPLENYFPDYWKQIFVIAYLRLFNKAVIKRMPHLFECSFFSEHYKRLAFSDKTISKIIREIGSRESDIEGFMKTFVRGHEIALIDATSIFTKSNNIYQAKLGYNHKKRWDKQVNLLYLYDYKESLPLFYRVTRGDLREINTLSLTLLSSGIKKAIIVGDKGFSSALNMEIMRQNHLDFILPLRRNSSMIDYTDFLNGTKDNMDGYFKYNKRYIWYKRLSNNVRRTAVIIYLDDELRIREERDYLERIEKYPEEYNEETFFERQMKMGTISLASNLSDKSAKELYEIYKSRCEIEQLFDVFKNILSADETYMHSIESMRGWFFVNHLALLGYYKIYRKIKQKDLLSKFSVEDIIIHLEHINKIRIGDDWFIEEIPKKTTDILKVLNLDFPIT